MHYIKHNNSPPPLHYLNKVFFQQALDKIPKTSLDTQEQKRLAEYATVGAPVASRQYINLKAGAMWSVSMHSITFQFRLRSLYYLLYEVQVLGP